MKTDIVELQEVIQSKSAWVELLRQEVGKVLVGQKYLLDGLLVGLLGNGHILLEGVPGLAKTLTVKTLAQVIDAQFQRIQFMPDLLPADILGTLIYSPQSGEFKTQKGPIFANIVLADEVNRAPAKVQSALLEAMQERQVTIGGVTYDLPKPFLVLATENPIDQEGTYPLPEAQVDRFMMKLKVGYPSVKDERKILDLMAVVSPEMRIQKLISLKQIEESREIVDKLYMDDRVKDYIVNLVHATRDPGYYKIEIGHLIQYGASPRATINLALASKVWAFLNGRAFVTPQDIKSIGMDVLRHRVIISYEAEAEGMKSEDIIQMILDKVPVP